MPADEVAAVVVGAGPAGLAAGACLIRCGIEPVVLERSASVASSWRCHYDRLHLHTVKRLSALPGLPFPREYPRYVPRDAFVRYLEDYAAHWRIELRFDEDVVAIERTGASWQTITRRGNRWLSRAVVVATGANAAPQLPTFAGQSTFPGRILHSRDYRDPQPFANQRVLVVGMGNTGAEIALDLAAHGVSTALSVRSPVNIVRRDVLGRPTQLTAIALSRLPQRWGDAVARLLRDLTVGDLSQHGLRRAPQSPLRQLREHGKTPVIDVGTVAMIRSGRIGVYPGLESFGPGGVRFADGRTAAFDAVIFATGYRPQVAPLFPQQQPPLDAEGVPTEVAGIGPLASVYFIGIDLRQAGGLLRTIGQQAQQVAQAIARHRAAGASTGWNLSERSRVHR
ncbi:MAG TPA: NAD(P)/FAD-dependent oxidoreductase [Burkholderiaceae bacterium]|nr:NAD(P)/FAD-dependent oxidoreductase [Burkholderiaceae bacterium]